MSAKTLSERADEIEHAKILELARIPTKSVLYVSGDVDPREYKWTVPPDFRGTFLMGHDNRLAKMPDKPTLFDFFRLRFFSANHVMQSARLARLNGLPDKVVLACLLHDICVMGFIRADHGYWAEQMLAPYVDEEVSWAIKAHQILRFYPDPSVGYEYPKEYIRLFGEDFRPEPYVDEMYKKLKNHKWYMTARLITLNDLYSFDPNVTVELEEFEDLVGRHFRQPNEGLGFDDSPSAHMWRTINWPTRFL